MSILNKDATTLNFDTIHQFSDINKIKLAIENISNAYIDNYKDASSIYFIDENSIRRSIFIDNKKMKPIVSGFNQILYNENAKNYLKNCDWHKIVVEKSYEGPFIMVFNCADTWHVSTIDYIDASEQKIDKNTSYKDLFEDAIESKFSYNELDKNLCYFFVLLHYKNKNLINYSNFDSDIMYKDVIHIRTVKKYTHIEVDYKINDKIKKDDKLYFSNLSELMDELDDISKDNRQKKKLTTEGYFLKHYLGEPRKSDIIVLKLQTDIYQELISIRPNNNNLHVLYLELYQKDVLTEYLPYFSKYNTDIVRRINNSMRTIAQEILDLYHGTRQQCNPEVYKNLKEQYKKSLYDLHGIFINYRKPKYTDNKEKHIGSRSVTVHDVYHYLKNKNSNQLRHIYMERQSMLEMPLYNKFLDTECLDTFTLTALMFQHNLKKKDNIDIITS